MADIDDEDWEDVDESQLQSADANGGSEIAAGVDADAGDDNNDGDWRDVDVDGGNDADVDYLADHAAVNVETTGDIVFELPSELADIASSANSNSGVHADIAAAGSSSTAGHAVRAAPSGAAAVPAKKKRTKADIAWDASVQRAHLVCLLAAQQHCNRTANNKQLQASILSLVPAGCRPQTVATTPTGDTVPSVQGLQALLTYFTFLFPLEDDARTLSRPTALGSDWPSDPPLTSVELEAMAARGHGRRAGGGAGPSSGGSLHTVNSLASLLATKSIQRPVTYRQCVLLFLALCRALGLAARLVCAHDLLRPADARAHNDIHGASHAGSSRSGRSGGGGDGKSKKRGSATMDAGDDGHAGAGAASSALSGGAGVKRRKGAGGGALSAFDYLAGSAATAGASAAAASTSWSAAASSSSSSSSPGPRSGASGAVLSRENGPAASSSSSSSSADAAAGRGALRIVSAAPSSSASVSPISVEEARTKLPGIVWWVEVYAAAPGRVDTAAAGAGGGRDKNSSGGATASSSSSSSSSPLVQRWVCLDPCRQLIDRPGHLEAMRPKPLPLIYCIASSASGAMRDVTRRYTGRWSEVEKVRIGHSTGAPVAVGADRAVAAGRLVKRRQERGRGGDAASSSSSSAAALASSLFGLDEDGFPLQNGPSSSATTDVPPRSNDETWLAHTLRCCSGREGRRGGEGGSGGGGGGAASLPAAGSAAVGGASQRPTTAPRDTASTGGSSSNGGSAVLGLTGDDEVTAMPSSSSSMSPSAVAAAASGAVVKSAPVTKPQAAAASAIDETGAIVIDGDDDDEDGVDWGKFISGGNSAAASSSAASSSSTSTASVPAVGIDEDTEMAIAASTAENRSFPRAEKEYKGHPAYAIESQLPSVWHVIHPKGRQHAVGFFKGQPIYPRAHVHELKTADQWLRSEGLAIREDQVDKPTKVISKQGQTTAEGGGGGGRGRGRGTRGGGGSAVSHASHVATINGLRFDFTSNNLHTGAGAGTGAASSSSSSSVDPYAAAAADLESGSGGSGSSGEMRGYGRWQTCTFIPPAVPPVGPIPVNKYGNFELFHPTMLPSGLVHVQHGKGRQAATKLGLQCADAVVGFSRRNGRTLPDVKGVVVLAADADTVLSAAEEIESQEAGKAAAKREKTILKRWEQLVRGVLVRERVRREYGSGSAGAAQTASTSATSAASASSSSAGAASASSSSAAPALIDGSASGLASLIAQQQARAKEKAEQRLGDLQRLLREDGEGDGEEAAAQTSTGGSQQGVPASAAVAAYPPAALPSATSASTINRHEHTWDIVARHVDKRSGAVSVTRRCAGCALTTTTEEL